MFHGIVPRADYVTLISRGVNVWSAGERANGLSLLSVTGRKLQLIDFVSVTTRHRLKRSRQHYLLCVHNPKKVYLPLLGQHLPHYYYLLVTVVTVVTVL